MPLNVVTQAQVTQAVQAYFDNGGTGGGGTGGVDAQTVANLIQAAVDGNTVQFNDQHFQNDGTTSAPVISLKNP
ncbi:hypothetical protein [Hymenobacter sp. BT491]|uniref:hypothetical protein n=1 Tax=Hymenobacter sp. BT491 TaxID=2766779 RepID=UPI0016537D2E|nr:hypothetical protein [Hymenobacter sp. BT491]MBC6988922.1 hypothetical protein [Hymenobacter sp. BT491]